MSEKNGQELVQSRPRSPEREAPLASRGLEDLSSLAASTTDLSVDQHSLALASDGSREGEFAYLQGLKSCRAHFGGDRKEEDLFETVRLWLIASDAGFAEASYQLVQMGRLRSEVLHAHYIRGYVSDAEKEDWDDSGFFSYDFEYPSRIDFHALLIAAANQGHPLAQLELGLAVERRATGEDFGNAWNWFLKAARQGVVGAKIALLRLLERGRVKPEEAQAAEQLLAEGAAEVVKAAAAEVANAAKTKREHLKELMAAGREEFRPGPFREDP